MSKMRGTRGATGTVTSDERFVYQTGSNLKAFAMLITATLCGGGVIILRSPSLSETIIPMLILAFVAIGLLLLILWSKEWRLGPPREAITIDADRKEVIFEWFRIYQPPSSIIGWQSSQVVPQLSIAFEDVLDLYHFRNGRRSTLRRLDSVSDKGRLPSWGTYHVITSRGSVWISMDRLVQGPRLVSQLLEMTQHSPAPPLSMNQEYKDSLWMGIGVSAAGLIMAVLAWDVESARWVFVVMLIIGAGKLTQAAIKVKKHQRKSHARNLQRRA